MTKTTPEPIDNELAAILMEKAHELLQLTKMGIEAYTIASKIPETKRLLWLSVMEVAKQRAKEGA